jgi:hypothetical protein
MKRTILFTTALALSLSIFAACSKTDENETASAGPPDAGEAYPAEVAALAYAVPFAEYEDYVYSGTPSVPAYTIDAGLGNVYNLLQFLPGERDWDSTFGYWQPPKTPTTPPDGLFSV